MSAYPRDIAEVSHAAHEVYKYELEDEIQRFRDYECSVFPKLRLQSTMLLEGLREDLIDIERAELALIDLRVGLEQLREE